jgi:5-methylcytosine-specific restriction endonuclease McrA
MSRAELIGEVARSDSTFRHVDGEWIGKCLICNGPLRFDARTGGGATIEHIIPRRMGGSDDLLNLGLTHARCNFEKGVQWDEPKRRRGRQKEYENLVTSLLTRRRARWREPQDVSRHPPT